MLVTGCIVCYNNDRKVLLEAIHSFMRRGNEGVSRILYLVDNSPTDSLRDIFQHSDVVYISNPSNPGFGAAHNIAIKLALKAGAFYHLVLNPDVFFNELVIDELVDFMNKDTDIGNVLPKVLYPDDSLQYLVKLLPTPYDWIGRRFNPFKTMVNKRNNIFELRFTGYNKIIEAPYLSGCFMFLRLSAIENIGMFDERIFMYGEEADLCRRLISGGYKTVFYPNVSIYHHFEKGSHKSWKLTKVGIRSAIYYFNKWGWIFDKERRKINRRTLSKLR